MSRALPDYVGVADVARYLGRDQRTVRRWIGEGQLVAAQVHSRHYSDERERLTGRGRWMVHVQDLEAFLQRHLGRGLDPAARRKLGA